MKKLLFWLYQPYVWLIFMPLVLVITFLGASLSVLFAILVNPHFASRHFAARWARWIAWCTPIRVSVEGAEHADRSRGYVVVSNHQSQYDILALYGWLDLDLKWVMKKELRKIPGIGIGCEKVGHIFVDRKRPEKARAAINKALKVLGNGIGILFFPEGTRSLDGRMLPFKKGAFRVALEQDLPILPVTLVGTRDILPAKTLRLFPGKIRVVIHPEIPTKDMTVDDMKTLMTQTRSVISSAMPAELQD